VGLLLPNDKKRSSNWTNAYRRLEGHNRTTWIWECVNLIPKSFGVDNRNALASVHVHEVFDYYQWPIRNQLLNALGKQ